MVNNEAKGLEINEKTKKNQVHYLRTYKEQKTKKKKKKKGTYTATK